MDSSNIDLHDLQPSLDKETEWKIKRLGKITSSKLGDLLRGTGADVALRNSKGAKDLIYKLAWERLIVNGDISGGLERKNLTSKSLAHGIDNEELAILEYEKQTGIDVIRNPYTYIDYDEHIGGTPDGFIDPDGIIEVKCPYNGGNHLQTLLEGVIYNDYYLYQIQGNLMITGRTWCDFVTFDPDLHESVNLAIVRVYRDEEMINNMRIILAKVVEKINILHDKFKSKSK